MNDAESHILFTTAGRNLALRAADVAEVLPLPELAVPPGLPEVIAGLLNFGGEIVPVLRTALLLGLPAGEPGFYAHLLLTPARPARLALLVDRVTAVERIPADRHLPVDGGETFRGTVTGEVHVDAGRMHLLSLDRLLSEAERRRVAAYGEAEARRGELFAEPA